MARATIKKTMELYLLVILIRQALHLRQLTKLSSE